MFFLNRQQQQCLSMMQYFYQGNNILDYVCLFPYQDGRVDTMTVIIAEVVMTAIDALVRHLTLNQRETNNCIFVPALIYDSYIINRHCLQ